MRMLAFALFAALLLSGCPGAVKPTLPAATFIEKPVKVFVPIDKALTARCPWPKSGKPSQSLEVARKRRECLEQYERQFDGIEKVEGKPVP